MRPRNRAVSSSHRRPSVLRPRRTLSSGSAYDSHTAYLLAGGGIQPMNWQDRITVRRSACHLSCSPRPTGNNTARRSPRRSCSSRWIGPTCSASWLVPGPGCGARSSRRRRPLVEPGASRERHYEMDGRFGPAGPARWRPRPAPSHQLVRPRYAPRASAASRAGHVPECD
jgi:hypothetical protein